MVTVRSGRQYLLAFGTKNAKLETIASKEIETENLIFVLISEKRKRDVLLKLCSHR